MTSYILLNSDNKNLYSKTKKNLIFDTKLIEKQVQIFIFLQEEEFQTQFWT